MADAVEFSPGRREFVRSAAGLTGLWGLYAAGNARAALPLEAASAEANPAETTAQGGAKRPNVLLILADDLGWSDLGCYGGEIQTPNLDALAKNGLRFTQFYNSARCCPSRAALLTGVNPHQAGFPDMAGTLPANVVTLPEVLKTVGYHTYMVGKWHLGNQSTPVTRGFDEFYGMIGGFNTYWKEDPYYTRLPNDRPKRSYEPGTFYSTNVFGDYALDFLEQGRASGKPWFLYLAWNAPHFPLHAPEEAIAKYEALYREKGWDAVRAERLARQKKLGLVPSDLALPPRGTTPPNFINTQTGWANKDIPAWNTLPAARRTDLARRMAVYAACVDLMDQNIGRVFEQLRKTGEWENTIVLFLSDNGACAEWDAFGFDQLDSPKNVVHTGEDLKKVGGPDSYISYGSGWANACDTPWRLFKHYAEEGGIRTPLIAHWPKGLQTKAGTLTTTPGFITDFMPTLVEVCGAQYPTKRNNVSVLPPEGESLVPTFTGRGLKNRILCVEHEGNRMVREGDWKLVAQKNRRWELYHLAKDPAETANLAAQEPQRVQKMASDWDAWAVRCNVIPKAPAHPNPTPAVPTPQIANRSLVIHCEVAGAGENRSGVLLAQGGNQQGYALYLQSGKPVFAVRRNGVVTEITAPRARPSQFMLEARLEKDGAMTLAVGGTVIARGKAGGLIPVQPKDPLTVGEDTLSAVGNYAPPNRFTGTVKNVHVRTAGEAEAAD